MKKENVNMNDPAELSEQEMSNISGGTVVNQDLKNALEEGAEQMEIGLAKPSNGSPIRFG